jgi:3-deoxy-D-manno-octulosonic-acid transferase
MYRIYSLLFSVGFVIAAPYYLWRRRGTETFAGLRERFGVLPASLEQDRGGGIWIHAVSVGETLAVAGLATELRGRYPDRKIFLSHVTAAGREAGEKRLPNLAGRFYLPFDWTWAVRRAFQKIRPSVLIIVETELWPNLLRAGRRSGCRTIVVNARLSDKSFPGYRLIRPFMRRVFDNVDRICPQTPADAERFLELGAPPERVVVAGNLKFDGRAPRLEEFWVKMREVFHAQSRRPVFVAASTMPGEEPLVLEAWNMIRKEYPQALMILAPRHPARFEHVAQLLLERGHSFIQRTALPAGGEGVNANFSSAEVLLLDTIGELAGVFALADAVFVGGSLVPAGGHNLLEPAYWGKPILFGPHMGNFREVAKLFLGAGAAIRVASAPELAHATLDLLRDAARADTMGLQARKLIEEQAGATKRILDQMEPWLAGPLVAAGKRPE